MCIPNDCNKNQENARLRDDDGNYQSVNTKLCCICFKIKMSQQFFLKNNMAKRLNCEANPLRYDQTGKIHEGTRNQP